MPSQPALLAACLPALAVAGLLLVVGGAGANGQPADITAGCGGGGTGQRVAGIDLDGEQLANARTIVATVARRTDLVAPTYAVVIAVTTAYTESSLHNSTVHTDHDSEGLFQQRISIYGKDVAAYPVKATAAFLDHLVGIPAWWDQAVGVVAQAVQRSSHPERYEPNAGLGRQLVGLLWPSAAAGRPDSPGPSAAAGTSGSVSSPAPASVPTTAAICPGGGDAGPITGPTGNNVAGTTTIPRGLVITGTAKGRRAVRFALQQLGEPYVFGAAGPDAWDCSGLTMGAWADAGVALPHYTVTQAQQGTPSPTDLTQAVGGDIVFIPGSDGTLQAPGHVGMIAGYVDKPDGRHLYLVQAPMAGVPVELTQATRWAGQVVAVRHIG